MERDEDILDNLRALSLEEWVTQFAVMAREIFEAKGYVEPVAFVQSRNKLRLVKLDFTNADAKDVCADVIRRMCARRDVERMMMISESWITEMTEPSQEMIDKIDELGIVESGAPRREIIMFRAEDRERMLTAEYEIIRNKAGKPTLKPFEIRENMDWTSGRFAQFMPHPKAMH